MKKTTLMLMMLLIIINIAAVRNWKIYTNTTHIHDMIEIDNKIYQATWGGLEVYDLQTDSFIKTYSIFDGLLDQNIKTISYLPSSETILLGTARTGINRLQNNRFQIPINEIIGLPDNKVNFIINSDSLIYVATDEGLTVFKDITDFPFPLPINHYATHNGLVSQNITSLALSADGYLFIGTDRGLNYVHTNTMYNITDWKLLSTANSFLPGNFITALSIRNDVIAIGTRNGLVRAKIQNSMRGMDIVNLQIFNESVNNLPSNNIFSVLVDSDYNIWSSYGIWNDNILIIEGTPNTVITKITIENNLSGWDYNTSGLEAEQIRGFKEIRGKIYAYSWGDGFFFYENNLWHNRKSNTMTANNITDIAIDRNGKVWVCNGSIGGDAQRRGNPGISGFDGFEWTTFQAKSSPLAHDRIFRITTDARNRKWFGSWNHGISVYDEDKDRWYYYNRARGLPANEIGALTTDKDNNIWISSYSGGMVILDLDAIESQGTIPTLASFHLYSPNITYSDVIKIFPTAERAFFGSFYSGIRIWDAAVFPQTHQVGDSWRKPPVSDLTDGFVYVYGIDSRQTHWGEEIWIASEKGLFMFDTNNDRWYRYGTGIKREIWQNNGWQRDRLYFVDEERLYGAAPTFPTAIYVDDFDRIWIGTESNGITVYDLSTDRFSVFNTDNSPLLSNNITALAYEPYSGNLYIGTNEGLNSVEIGKILKGEDPALSAAIAYPNPFYPEKGQIVNIANKSGNNLTIFPQGKNRCRIYNINGELIITLQENKYFEFSWDGNNQDGKKCGSGVYFYVVSSEDGQSDRGTILLVR